MSKMEEGEGFLEALANKYNVSWGFRILDLNRFAIKIINKKTIGEAFLIKCSERSKVLLSVPS